MKKFEGLSLTVALAVAGAVSGCDQHKDWQASAGPVRVCVDQQGRRVPEADCPQTHTTGAHISPFLWYYLGALSRGGSVPAYGGLATGGSFQPRPGVAYGPVPAGGIARGGFGGTAHSFGGLGGFGE
ncbi:MAG: hypothetical protein WA840_04810 [Caulobacteraceae bacterium]